MPVGGCNIPLCTAYALPWRDVDHRAQAHMRMPFGWLRLHRTQRTRPGAQNAHVAPLLQRQDAGVMTPTPSIYSSDPNKAARHRAICVGRAPPGRRRTRCLVYAAMCSRRQARRHAGSCGGSDTKIKAWCRNLGAYSLPRLEAR